MSLPLLPIMEANTSFMTVCNQLPLRLPIMQYQRSLTFCWRSFPGRGREGVSPSFDINGGQHIENEQWRTIVNILRSTVWSLYVTINRTSCNSEWEMGPDGCSQTWRNWRVDGYKSGIGPRRSSRSSFWMGLDKNKPCFHIQTRTTGRYPGPGTNTSFRYL